jgi:hypothetical protein
VLLTRPDPPKPSRTIQALLHAGIHVPVVGGAPVHEVKRADALGAVRAEAVGGTRVVFRAACLAVAVWVAGEQLEPLISALVEAAGHAGLLQDCTASMGFGSGRERARSITQGDEGGEQTRTRMLKVSRPCRRAGT